MKVHIIFSILFVALIFSCIQAQPQHSSVSQPSPEPQRLVEAQPSSVPQLFAEAQPSAKPQPSAKFQHAPYAEEMCAVCHDSDTPGANDLIQEAPESCYNCHDEYSQTFVHSPVSVGACLLCHNPHESEYKFFLNQQTPELCYLCHERIEAVMTNEEYIKHAPKTVDNCVNCHDPHESDVSNKFLQSDMTTLCTDCHIKEKIPMETDVAAVTHKHQPVEEEGRCAQCHTAHASPFEFHLIAEPMDLCLTCHNTEVTAYDGKNLANMEELFKNNPEHHGPIIGKSCAGCHNPHGTDYFRILTDEYPSEFYTEEFSVDNYALCFFCHESEILRDAETSTLTNFRDGANNLHFLHVNRAEKGRTCRACHETHASTHPKHIRDSVPFGKINWPLELKYQVEYADINTGEACDTPSATCVKTGGSCVACHKRLSYSYRKGEN